MKLRTTKYIIKEGFVNAYRNKLMTLASITIVTAALIMFGVFYLISAILNDNTEAFKSKLEMEAFLKPDLEEEKVDEIEEQLKGNGMILEYTKITKQEAYEKAKELLGDDQKVLEGIDESFLPVSFKIKLTDPETSETVVKELEGIIGVESVKYSQKAIDLLQRVTYWARMVSGILIAVLLIIAMFIISNTIKLTVFARRKEIGIMKYIGATDWFIRWPFVVEGIIIGLFGAIIAFIITGNAYSAFESRISADFLDIGTDLVRFVDFRDIRLEMAGIYALIGIFIGMVGSMISIRKYLRV